MGNWTRWLVAIPFDRRPVIAMIVQSEMTDHVG